MKTLDAQNINALGGIIIDDENEEKLIHIMKAEKGKYTHSDLQNLIQRKKKQF